MEDSPETIHQAWTDKKILAMAEKIEREIIDGMMGIKEDVDPVNVDMNFETCNFRKSMDGGGPGGGSIGYCYLLSKDLPKYEWVYCSGPHMERYTDDEYVSAGDIPAKCPRRNKSAWR